jgi:aflatoxin B1 aldehyde reductase
MGSTTERPGICHFDSPEDVKALLTTLWNRGYRELDTAANYPGAEERIGAVIAASKASSSSSSSFSPEPEAKAEPLTFTLHTKVADGLPGSHTAAKLAASIAQSLAELRVEQVETIFLHVPDRETRFEEQVKGMHDAVQAGQARQWGISNYSAEEVKSMIRICEEEGWTKPSV